MPQRWGISLRESGGGPDGTHLQTLELTLGLKQEVQGSGESVEICAVAQGGIEAAVKGGTRGKRFSSDPKEAPECPKKKPC